MAKVTTIGRKSFLMKLYSAFQRKVIQTTSFHYTPHKVYSQFIWSDSSCYCTPTVNNRSNKFRAYKIVFGGKFFVDHLGLPKTVDIKQCFATSKKLLYGVYYHEIGHIRFTAMGDTRIRDYKDQSLAPALHNLMNVLEDICIERCGLMKQYPYTKDYLLFLQSTIFEPEYCLDQYNNYFDSVDEEKCGEAFIAHLLYWLRCGQSYQGTNKFFTNHQADVVGYVKKFMMTTNAKDRITLVIQFFEWLLSQGLEFQNPNHMPSNTPQHPLVNGQAPDPSQGTSGGSGGITSSGSCNNDGSEDGSGSNSGNSSGGDDETSKHGSSGESAGDGSGLTASDLESFQAGSADVPVEYYSAKKWFDYKESVLGEVEKLLQQTAPLIGGIANRINILKAKAKPKMRGGYRSGRLDIKKAIKGEINGRIDHDVFERKNKSGICTDVAISFLVDCSGSMSGSKSLISSAALIAMAKACEKTATPCEINLFSTDYSDDIATIVNIKEFRDSFRTCKPYLGLACYDLWDDYTCTVPSKTGYGDCERLLWSCNYDEVCVSFVATALEARQESYKVLVVLSDGGTCGSQDDLVAAVKNISTNANIGMVGIGIGTDLPKKIYPDCKIYRDIKELQDLPVFLGEKLLKIMKGER